MAKKAKSTSKFDGGFWGYLGVNLLALLVTVITAGLGSWWAICKVQRWKTSHTVIDGRRLYFDGKAMQLLGTEIKWLFFTVITLGIFALWLPVRYMNWVAKHTHHASLNY